MAKNSVLRLIATGCLLATVSFFFSGCGAPTPSESEALQVVTTTTMLTDLAREIAGDDATVTGLMGPSVDPHMYRMTAQDGRLLREADLVLFTGHYLEGAMSETFHELAANGRPMVAVAERLDEAQLLAPDDFEGSFDPHVWFDPALWQLCATIVGEALAEADPANAAAYRERAAAYREELAAIDAWAEGQLQTIPTGQRVLITSHDAYNYFGRRYDFEVVGVQGISTASEAGLADIASLVDFIRNRQLPAIFVESSVSPQAIERISEDSGARIGGELFSDAMGVPGEEETWDGVTYDLGTYEGMVKHNVNRIVAGLRGEARDE